MPYANNNGVRIHYEVEGQGPPLVMQHGFSGSLEQWEIYGYTKELRHDYQLILIDARGHGLSDKSHDYHDYTNKVLVEDVVTVLDDFRIERCNYFGYSMGGRIGFHSLYYTPDRFFSLVLGGWGFPRQGHDDIDRKNLKTLRLSLEKTIKDHPDNAIEAFVANREKESGPTLPAIKSIRLSNDAQALLAASTGMDQPGLFDPKTVLPDVTLPCFVFAGEIDPIYEATKASANLLPNAIFLSVPNADHGKAFQQPDIVLPYIREFFTRSDK